ncbi:MAG: serine hydrolase [Acidobacteriota bacterium]
MKQPLRWTALGLTLIVLACTGASTQTAGGAAGEQSPVYGRWRALTQGPLGMGIVQLDIEPGEDGKPVLILDGQIRSLVRYPWENAVVTGDGASAEYRILSYDVAGYSSGTAKLEARLVAGGSMLRVEVTDHHRTVALVFERDGPKFARFDSPRLDASGLPATDYVYAPPAERTNDGLEVASLEDVGLRPELFEDAVRDGILKDEYPEITSLLVLKDGKLVFEEYFNGNHADNLHYQASVSKTWTAMLLGAALRDGVLESIEVPVLDLLPDYRGPKWDRPGAEPTVRDFLMMKDIVGWDEGSASYNSPDNDLLKALRTQPDPFRYLFERELLAPDASRPPSYNTMITHTLGLILMRKTGKNLLDSMDEQILQPLKIGRAVWGSWSSTPRPEPEAIPLAGSTLHVRSRDMLKFGQMLLDGGRWQGVQVVPEPWVRESLTLTGIMSPRWGYGYQTWIIKLDNGERTLWVARGDGHGGQTINVVPELNAVVVTTSNNYYGDGKLAGVLVRERILPAMIGGTRPFDHANLTVEDLGYQTLAHAADQL